MFKKDRNTERKRPKNPHRDLSQNHWGCSSVVKHLPSMYKALGPIPSTIKTKTKQTNQSTTTKKKNPWKLQ
jgi:hypothetical protein